MVDAAERENISQYLKKHDIEELVRTLVEGLLRAKPDVQPKEHWAHMLRVEKIKDKTENTVDGGEAAEAAAASEVPGRMLIRLFESTKRITSEIVPAETIKIIIAETCKLLGCDRVSLFVYDKRLNMLVLNASNLNVPIRVKPTQGIAGHVFTTLEQVNIPDCYADSRFDQNIDKQTGYKTNHLLVMPLVDFEGEALGVLQAINKKPVDGREGAFTRIDEILLENLTQHVSVALRNAEVYRAAIVTSERANALLHMIQSLSQDLGMQSTILTITMHASELVQADRCTVFLVDEGKEQLWSVSTDSGKEIRIPKSKGIAGECATEGKLIAIEDCYQDARFNQSVDKETGYKTTSMLAVPVLRKKRTNKNVGNCLAVIQMINKMEFDGAVGKFDDEDIQVMETFATFVASRLEGSSLMEKSSQKKTDSEADKAFSSSGQRSERQTQDLGMRIQEGDEEEEDE